MRAKKQLKPDQNQNLYIAYYRVSTEKQGERGLGIQAQRDAIERYMTVHPEGILFACFTEVESGRKRGDDRPGLQAALDLARATGATLLIAKLDRLARNVYFISGLMESGVTFNALDLPEANRFTLHIMAAVAEQEARRISESTSAAIQAKLHRGAKWGFALPCRDQHLKTRKQTAREFANKMSPVLQNYLQDKYSLSKIATELNRLGYETASGLQGSWTARAVKNCLEWVNVN